MALSWWSVMTMSGVDICGRACARAPCECWWGKKTVCNQEVIYLYLDANILRSSKEHVRRTKTIQTSLFQFKWSTRGLLLPLTITLKTSVSLFSPPSSSSSCSFCQPPPCTCLDVCMCVCVRVREKERQRQREREGQRGTEGSLQARFQLNIIYDRPVFLQVDLLGQAWQAELAIQRLHFHISPSCLCHQRKSRGGNKPGFTTNSSYCPHDL